MDKYDIEEETLDEGESLSEIMLRHSFATVRKLRDIGSDRIPARVRSWGGTAEPPQVVASLQWLSGNLAGPNNRPDVNQVRRIESVMVIDGLSENFYEESDFSFKEGSGMCISF